MSVSPASSLEPQRRSIVAPVILVAGATLLALALRLYRLAEPVLRWDEGWSLAHATLSWPSLWQVATEEWHPPLYAVILKLWLAFGKSAGVLRLLSVALGVAAVPLAYLVAREWSGRTRVAVLSAGFAAVFPLLVYYGQVARMYALAAVCVLAAAWLILRGNSRPAWYLDAGLLVASAASLYSLYYTAWVLAGLWAYAAVMRPARVPRLALVAVATLIAYVPWLVSAGGTIQARVASGSPAGGNPLWGTLSYIRPALDGLAFAYGAGVRVAIALAVVLAVGLVAVRFTRADARLLTLPVFVVSISVVGIAYSAQAARWFAVRHLVPASLFLGFAVAWALDRMARRWRPLLPAAIVALGALYWPASSGFVYEKTLEVVDPFDPSADYRYLTGNTGPGDLVYFNVLSKAGWYENLRGPRDAGWSYAMRWDPIVEPMDRIARRVERDSAAHSRLWFVLYKGAYGPNAELKAWLDGNLFPAGGVWQEDTLMLAYASPPQTWASVALTARFENGIRLAGARFSDPLEGGAGAVELTWETDRLVGTDCMAFVHAVDDSGRLVAQHDAPAGTEARPTSRWQPGQPVADRHGLFLPASGRQTEALTLRVGLYDPRTLQRLLLEDGSDYVEIGRVAVK